MTFQASRRWNVVGSLGDCWRECYSSRYTIDGVTMSHRSSCLHGVNSSNHNLQLNQHPRSCGRRLWAASDKLGLLRAAVVSPFLLITTRNTRVALSIACPRHLCIRIIDKTRKQEKKVHYKSTKEQLAPNILQRLLALVKI